MTVPAAEGAGGFVDVHAHVLPGVDDGAPDLATALDMLRAAARAGTSTIVATPHQHPGRYPNRAPRLLEAHAELGAAVDRARAAGETLPQVLLGAEVHLDGDLVERVLAGDLLRLASGPYLLLELPDVFPLALVEELVWTLQLRGVRPVLAHPERVGQIARSPEQLRRLVELGALSQLTGASVAGDFGPPCRQLAERFVREGCCHVVASDGHDLRRRPPLLDGARRALEALVGAEGAERLLAGHPAAIARGEPLDLPPPPPRTRPRTRAPWWRKLLDRATSGD